MIKRVKFFGIKNLIPNLKANTESEMAVGFEF
jgi:hypothetical protein